ncbi:MAG: hypothetical protein HYW50_02695 [Candidatus Diapherotrites archaeon]|nr:hypothetical protein [Candidatus Diapherotrites archaeon]
MKLTARNIARKIKRTWRKTTARRVLRGTFGPGEKTLKHVKNIFEKNRLKREKTRVRPDNELDEASDVGRIASKYCLDAFNIKSQQTRARVFDIMEEMLLQEYRYRRDYDKEGMPPVVTKKFFDELQVIFGEDTYKFFNLFWKKYEEVKRKLA